MVSTPALPPPAAKDDPVRAAALAVHQQFVALHGDLPTVSFAELCALPPTTVVVDVRTAGEVAVSRMPGSITAAEFTPARSGANGRPPPVVAVCTVGLRAAVWARDLAGRGGYAGPVYVSQGVLLHALDGGKMVRAAAVGGGGEAWQSVTEVHVYHARYRLVPRGWSAAAYSTPVAAAHGLRFAPALARALVSSSVPHGWWNLRREAATPVPLDLAL
jgi:rhodanese-related sulfurtransferase